MNLPISKICKQTQAIGHFQSDKVVIIMGATGTGKSRLAIDLATQFPAEIINCDKIQVYKGLDIATNKVTNDECRGVPHHLIGIIDDPDTDFTTSDFVREAFSVIGSILGRRRVPILAGGSNSFIDALLSHENGYFRSRYVYCLVWVDADLTVLGRFVTGRVDQMVRNGLVDEVRGFFDPNADHSRGLRRAIGVPELDRFVRGEGRLEDAIEEIKANTCQLAQRQLSKIQLLIRKHRRWPVHRIDATEAFRKKGKDADVAWDRLVVDPATMIVGRFLRDDSGVVNKMKSRGKSVISMSTPSSSPARVVPAAAMAST